MKRRRTDLAWPVCSIPGCRHGHSWASAEALTIGVLGHEHWIDRTGAAVCSCHGGRGSFPCDEGAVE